MFPSMFSLAFYYCDKQHGQNQLEEEGDYLAYTYKSQLFILLVPVIRPIAETSNYDSQVTYPFTNLRSGWGVAGHKKFKQTCNSRLLISLLLGKEGVCASSHMWRSEDSICKLDLSSHHKIKDWTQVVMLTQQTCTCWATSLPLTHSLSWCSETKPRKFSFS